MQKEILLKGTGTQIRFALNQIDVAKVTFDKEAKNGIAAEKPEKAEAIARRRAGQRAGGRTPESET